MIAEPLYGLQAALVAALKGTPNITALVGDRIYDWFPPGAQYPALALGIADQSVALELAPDCGRATESFLQVQAVSRDEAAPGMQTVKQLAGEVEFALIDWRPTIAGHVVDGTEFIDCLYDRVDGLTSRAIMTFRVTSQFDG